MNANSNTSNSSWRELYPFTSRFHELAEIKMHYVDEGQGRPLVFVHGNPTWSFYYRELIKHFRQSHRAVAVDHVGCGLSDKPQSYRYQLSQHIDNLISLIDTLDLRDATLVAHDWGGAIGLGTVLKRQSRFKNIVLFNTGAFPPPFVPFRIRVCRWPVFGPIAVRGLNGFAKAAVTMATEQSGGLSPEIAAGMLAPYDSWQNRVAINGFVKDIPLSKRHPTWETLHQIEAGLSELNDTMQIQLIWGMRDWCFTPECLDRFIDHMPAAAVHEFEDAGHYVVEDAIEQIIPLLSKFLNSN